VVERLATGLQGYARIQRHVLSADVATVIVAQAEGEPEEGGNNEHE
jgi:hypothetical protein